jgi:hypothetical protein
MLAIVFQGDDIEDLHFYEKLVKQTLCLMNCKNSTMPEMTSQMPKDVVEDFEWKLPYDYLQLCYYQVPSNQRTVFSSSSSFPFLIVLSRLPPC